MNLFEQARFYLFSRKKSYLLIFRGNPRDGTAVLEDLATFCRAHQSTYHTDPHVSERLEGRREVWLRIQNHLQLTDDELWKLYGNPVLNENGGRNVHAI